MVTAGLKQPMNRPIYFNSIHGQILQADKHQLQPEKLMSPRSTSFPEGRLPHRSVFCIRMSLNILLLPSNTQGKLLMNVLGVTVSRSWVPDLVSWLVSDSRTAPYPFSPAFDGLYFLLQVLILVWEAQSWSPNQQKN